MNAADLGVRSATPADLDAIISLHIAARNAYYRGFVPEHELAEVATSATWHEAHRQRITDPGSTTFCAERGGDLAGFVMLGPPYEPAPDPGLVGQLFQIHVSPASWRQGIGSALHAAAVQAWRSAPGRHRARGRLGQERARPRLLRRAWLARPDGHRRPGAAGIDQLRLTLTIPPA